MVAILLRIDQSADSYIADIRAARDQKVALYYITKYIMKAPEFEDMEDYVTFLKAIAGVRRLHRYGVMLGFRIELREPCRHPYCDGKFEYVGKVHWEFIGEFDDLITVIGKVQESP